MLNLPLPMRVPLAALVLLLCLGADASAPAAEAKPGGLDVLVISTFSKDLPAQQALERGLDVELGYRRGRGRVFYEFLDIPRVGEEPAVAAMSRMIAEKYHGMSFDAVIAWAEPAARVVAKLGPSLGNAQLHFPEVTPEQLAALGLRDGLSHAFSVDYQSSLAEAIRVSKAERMVVIGEGNPTGTIRLDELRRAAAAHTGLEVEEWIDLPLDLLRDRLATLPDRTMVFYLLLFSDGKGTSLTPFEAARRLAEASATPIFSAWESLMGSGIVGGHLLSHEELGRIVARSILNGRPHQGQPMRHAYDWARLDWWDLDTADLPAEAVILNRRPSLLEQYPWQSAIAAAFVCALAGLSLALARAVALRGVALRQLAAERESLAERVEERTAALARSNAELEQFAYAVSHDLRQPLRMVNSFLQLLERRLEGSLGDDTREMIGFASGGARRMDSMILSLLDYSRVGRQGYEPIWIDTRHSLDEALAFLQPAIEESGAEIVVSGDWPKLHVAPDAFERVLLNLVGNAVKFREPGVRPRVEIGVEENKAEWRFRVRDNGIGIAPDEAQGLFQVFHRLVPSEAYEGTGIGLAICRRLIERQGGRIWVESDGPGKGATFHFTIPKVGGNDAAPPI